MPQVALPQVATFADIEARNVYKEFDHTKSAWSLGAGFLAISKVPISKGASSAMLSSRQKSNEMSAGVLVSSRPPPTLEF